MSANQLRVFVGSAMTELRDVREIVDEALKERGIDAFVYEADAGAQPETIVETSLRELGESDLFVGLFWKRYPKVTTLEFQEARDLELPCFVYVRDKETERESELEQFLKNSVYDLETGVSYDFFDSALELGKRVASDVMSWLVRRHREMTAELAESRVSALEKVRLEREVQRLQAASRERLPRGTAADRLAADLRGWFATLGYGLEREIERTDQAFEWLINIPERRRYVRVLVRGVEGEAQLCDLEDLRSSREREQADEGWLVSVRRVSSAVQEAIKSPEGSKLFCYALDELLDEEADFSGYLDWLEGEIRRQKIDELFVPLAATKNELDADGKHLGVSLYGRENGWLHGYIDRWLDDPSKEHVSILGEFGTGKTWFALYYAWQALHRYREAKERGIERPRMPIVIPLRDYAKAVSAESLFSEFFFRKHEIPLPGYSAFEQLNRMGKLLLIFDGFDEMAAKVDRQQMINNFWELARIVVPGAKAILTCRTEHFPDAKEGRALLGAELMASTAKLSAEPPQFEVLELQKFDDKQVRELLGHRTGSDTVELVMESSQLLDLVRRPVMTTFVLDALPEIEAGKQIDISRIYLYAISRKLERDTESGRTFTSLADKLYFMSEISWEMLSTDRMSLNYRLFPDHLANLFGPVVREQKDLDHWHYDMMGNSMLVRTSSGEYSPAHRSLLEFFVAYKFAAELGVLAGDFLGPARQQSNIDHAKQAQPYTWSSYFTREVRADGELEKIAPLADFEQESLSELLRTFGRMPLTKAILDLMENMLVETAPQQLRELAAATSETQAGVVGGNSVTLLLRANPGTLRHRVLDGAQLQYADFTNADLTGCSLRGASLAHSQIRQTTLEGADLTDADVSHVVLSDPTFLDGVVVSPDGEKYAFSIPGGVIVQSLRDGRDLYRLPSPRGAIAWSPDGEYIACGSRKDGVLGLWRASDGSGVFAIQAYKNWVSSVAFTPDGQIITGGGMEDFPLKMWSLEGDELGQSHVGPGNQVNGVGVSADGEFVMASFWDRRDHHAGKQMKTGTVLFRRRPNWPLEIVREFDWAQWEICTFHRSSRFAGGTTTGISVFDTRGDTVATLPHGGYPIRLSKDDELLVAASRDDAWLSHVATGHTLARFQFGPSRDDRSRGACFDFTPDGSIVIGGWNDGTLRLWDSRLFVELDGTPHIPMNEYSPTRPPDADPKSWPVWWFRSQIEVPSGMRPNPNLGSLLRVVELKSNFNGLCISGVTGLDSVIVHAEHMGRGPEGPEEVQDWLQSRGAFN